MREFKKLWIAFICVIVASFTVLGYFGYQTYREAPPIPDQVVEASGTVLFTGQDIRDGQNVWQSMGGHNIGSIWGHGSYVAPDWTADWLHREAVFMLDRMGKDQFGKAYSELNSEQQAVLNTRLQQELRKNTYDPQKKTISISPLRTDAIQSNSQHYSGLLTNDPELAGLREAYAIPANTIKDRVN